MFNNLKIAVLPLAACLAAMPFAYAADPAPAAPGPANSSAPAMDHSAADGKSMRMMKDKKTAPPATPESEPNMMGHSPADGKSMRTMNDKKAAPGDAPEEDHNLMGHSPADGKSMRAMKHKKARMHHSKKKAAEEAPATGDGAAK